MILTCMKVTKRVTQNLSTSVLLDMDLQMWKRWFYSWRSSIHTAWNKGTTGQPMLSRIRSLHFRTKSEMAASQMRWRSSVAAECCGCSLNSLNWRRRQPVATDGTMQIATLQLLEDTMDEMWRKGLQLSDKGWCVVYNRHVKLQWKISSRIDIRLSEGGVRTICSSTHGNMTCTNRDEVQQVFPHMNEPHSLNHSWGLRLRKIVLLLALRDFPFLKLSCRTRYLEPVKFDANLEWYRGPQPRPNIG